MVLLVVVIATVVCVWQIFRHSLPDNSVLGPVTQERDLSWDHEPSCRCRTCRD